MAELLPVGTYVQVTPFPITGQSPYTGRVIGYDIHHSKYRIGREYMPGLFAEWSSWAFPREVEAIDSEVSNV
jgi:hypothetical protein